MARPRAILQLPPQAAVKYPLAPGLVALPPSRSHIFDQPEDASAAKQSVKKARKRQYVDTLRTNLSVEDLNEKARWNADPWYRISRTPMRECAMTRQMMPSGVMINWRTARSDQESDQESEELVKGSPNLVLPDRILHPKFAKPKTGLGMWTICHREAISRLDGGGPQRKYLNQTRSTVPPDVDELVYLQLCVRIEQELKMLAGKLRRKGKEREGSLRQGVEAVGSVLKRLTSEEAKIVQEGQYDFRSGMAMFDLAGARAAIDGLESNNREDGETDEYKIPDPADTDLQIIPGLAKFVPVYSLARLFPPTRLKRVCELLDDVLRLAKPETPDLSEASGSTRATAAASSDMLLLHSTPSVASDGKADDRGVDLAIAFWRLRCFFGQGWETVNVDGKGRPV